MQRLILSLVSGVLLFGCGGGVVEIGGAPPDDPGDLSSGLAFNGDPANNALFAVDISMWEGPTSQYEMDCFWDAGARHLVAGTQVREITRQQLAMATSRGMTVDAYVYLYWDTDLAAQVQKAFATVQGFPIGRMWLDIEQDPAGRSSAVTQALIGQAITACRAQTQAPCGIYTGSGFWRSFVANTPNFADLPLWYALYNNKTTLSDWTTEKFGGWVKPQGKQFTMQAFCGMGADRNVLQRVTQPTVTVDRTPPPAPTAPPAAPTGLYPADGSVVSLSYAKLMASTVPGATSYDLAMESWNGSAFVTYVTWTQAKPFLKTSPYWNNHLYRFRARAKNAFGAGPWSAWSTFDFGTYTGVRPGAPPPAPPPPPPGPSGTVPTGLNPSGGLFTSASVTLTCLSVQAATRYEFAIEYGSPTSWAPYFNYVATAPATTFWPQAHGKSYRFKVRAEVGGVWGAWSDPATFQFQ